MRESTDIFSKSPLVVGLGEALFDCFEDRTVLGGAPNNVAVHAASLLARVGGLALPVTRVGCDELGERFQSESIARELPTCFVQKDAELPTGRVRVSLDELGHASYVFDPHSAWDALRMDDELQMLASRCDAVAFGTLAQRNELSRKTIHSFLHAAPQALRLFDINLRQKFYTAEVIDASLGLASAVKLNADELEIVCDLLDVGINSASGFEDATHFLCATYHLDWLALTRGEDGTLIFCDGKRYDGAPASYPRAPNADSVGAGDACCAGLICGMLLGWPIQRTLDLANRLGAFVASRPGATPMLPQAILETIGASGGDAS